MRVSASKKEDRMNEKELDGVLRGKHAWERENVKEKRQKNLEKVAKPLRKKPRVTRVNARVSASKKLEAIYQKRTKMLLKIKRSYVEKTRRNEKTLHNLPSYARVDAGVSA